MAKKNLLIVESPAKAKTIEKILGSEFEVKSCFGHIRDLVEPRNLPADKKKGFLGIECGKSSFPWLQCTHEEVCAKCGKVLRWGLSAEECPDLQK